MNDSSPGARASAILDRTDGPSDLLDAARAFGRLERALHTSLPEARSLRVACVRDGELVMAAASPVWATRARMMSEDILAAAGRHWPRPLESVRVIIVPPRGHTGR